MKSQALILTERLAGLTMALSLVITELGNTVPGFAERLGPAIGHAIASLKPEYQASGSATVLLQLRQVVDLQQQERGATPPERH